MSIYTEFGLKRVINASGKMTALGASAVHPSVAEALNEASQNYVVMDDLMKTAGKFIAEETGAEDGCPVSGAAAGIAISIAACITGTNLNLIERIPFTQGLKNEVVVQKGHSVHFGASITQMIMIGGGVPIEVGQANHTEKAHITEAINERTACLLYVKSHHPIQKGMQSIESMLEVARDKGIPLIVDAAAEEDLHTYIQRGADLVIYSGAKAIEGPTSGFICGRSDLIRSCHAQYKGIARPMKIGKEAIMGLLAALRRYKDRDDHAEDQIKRMKHLLNQLEDLPGIQGRLVQDEAGRAIYRAELQVDAAAAGVDARGLIRELESGNPSIYTRNYYANVGKIAIDPRPMRPGEEDLVADRIRQIIGNEA
ncbi:DgaE family pyridoxal phosphate-dependent ammonia lyase [Paenibacillus larvae]